VKGGTRRRRIPEPVAKLAAGRLIQPDFAVLAVFAAIISKRRRLRRKNPGVPAVRWSKEQRVTASRPTVNPLYQKMAQVYVCPATNPPSPPNRNRQFDVIALISQFVKIKISLN
jgi:hypothetical protein